MSIRPSSALLPARGITALAVAALVIGGCSETRDNPGGTATSATKADSAVGEDRAVGFNQTESSSKWRLFADQVDRICATNYSAGLNAEEAVERVARRRDWPAPRVEAEIRYGWAAERRAQYRAIDTLGAPPNRNRLFRRWQETALQRARIYRRWGRAWGESDEVMMSHHSLRLDIATARADELASHLPFRVCGRGYRDSPLADEPTRKPPREYLAAFPAQHRELVRRAAGVYWYHEKAGRVVDLIKSPDSAVARIRIERKYARRAVDTQLQLFRARRDPGETWITIVPASEPHPRPGGVTLTAVGGSRSAP